jgi:hypothetical protein
MATEVKPSVVDLRALARRAREGDEEAQADLKREIARRRQALPAREAATGPPDAAWQEEFRRAAEPLRAGVPEEWSEEELLAAIEEEVTAVRQKSARHG